MTGRLQNDYKPQEQGGNYTKLIDGQNKLRVLSSPLVGYIYFDTDKKPHRSRERFETTPGIKENDKQKEFWSIIVYNYITKKTEIIEITQNSIKNSLYNLAKDEDFGDPREYDIKINKTGQMLETRYEVQALSKSEFKDKEVLKKAEEINLDALFTNDDPFQPVENKEDLPF